MERSDGPTLYLPCGHCRHCRMSRSREWYVRLYHESTYHDKQCFATLSYNDDNLPEDVQLHPEDVTLFLKKIRNNTKSKIKYYISGEYGDEYGRPHWHCILFGVDLSEHTIHKRWNPKTKRWALVSTSGPLNKSWKKGEIVLGTVTKDSLRYTTDYIHKKLYGDAAEKDGRVQPLARMSTSIGKQFALDNADQIKNQKEITIFGVKMSVPRYYAKVLDIEKELRKPLEKHAYLEYLRDPKKDYRKRVTREKIQETKENRSRSKYL